MERFRERNLEDIIRRISWKLVHFVLSWYQLAHIKEDWGYFATTRTLMEFHLLLSAEELCVPVYKLLDCFSPSGQAKLQGQ